ncbi:MAG: Holliday junction resolvase RuvX [Bacteroidia bacterium]|nr:Holliday junction resolvase RuvX [Bacteroidia bacterium]
MGRLLGIDYGLKRTGLAWTDILQISVSGIGGVETEMLESKLKEIVGTENIERIVLGFPTRTDGSDTHSTEAIRALSAQLKVWFPEIPVSLHDEQFSSKMAKKVMFDAGVKKSKRRDKHLINQTSAVIILQDFLGRI